MGDGSGATPADGELAQPQRSRAVIDALLGVESRGRSVLADLNRLDQAVYAAVAETPTPSLDSPLRSLSSLANHSKIWFAIAAGIAVAGGPHGRRVAIDGVAAIGGASLVVNAVAKPFADRRRPNRVGHGVPQVRGVKMPTSTSFPSGHSASAFAFATAVGKEIPAISGPLRGLAGAVAYSRVHTGVHYPTDVIIGSILGSTIGDVTSTLVRYGARRWAA